MSGDDTPPLPPPFPYRELKDRLSKASTESEYKTYQREQEVRRELEGDLARWKQEAEVRGRGEEGMWVG